MKEFSKLDWNGLAGAEPWDDDQQPLISYDLVVVDWPEQDAYKEWNVLKGAVTLITDRNGLSILGFNSFMNIETKTEAVRERCITLCNALLKASPVTVSTLLEIGFRWL